VGDRVVVANQSAIAGHCVIEDDVIIGGLVGIHQFVRIGRGAIIGAVAMVTNDVIPYGMVQAPRGELDGLNLVGLKRRGVGREEITPCARPTRRWRRAWAPSRTARSGCMTTPPAPMSARSPSSSCRVRTARS
jgi:acyl-[acyl carrier protein]--UDP-N-acetylglucosamine O-acyltransferase